MSTAGNLDLAALLRGMAAREAAGRTEATVQSDLRTFLLAAPLALEERHLNSVLEQQAGGGRRIDVEAGLCVFEVKRDLRKGKVRGEAEEQLAAYVAARAETMQQRYVGVLTDGAEWHLYHLADGKLTAVSAFTVDSKKPDIEGLSVWLEGVLGTAAITPTPTEIGRRLGATSPSHAIDYAELARLYARHRDFPAVRLKRELWARLLTTAFGTGFKDSDELFVEHTLLVVTAELIAHEVIGLDPTAQDVAPAAIVEGQLFTSVLVHGVVEPDFFDWVVDVNGGGQFVRLLARRLHRFDWRSVEHDVLKVLYESIISAAQRKQLGEYYTPDWLAERIVDATIAEPSAQRVLDPACGSGTFLFHAVRRYLEDAEGRGTPNGEALPALTQRVIGMDIHPVAVTFARVTYLLAIGPNRLQAEDRPPISVPVYLGDSIQWGQERTLFASDALVIPTVGGELFARELRFPKRTLADAGRFDQLVSEMSRLATSRPRGSAVPQVKAAFRRYAVHPDDEAVLTETFTKLCQLHDEGRDHIWGYYVRNLARPVWLSRPENRVSVLVGNPPWLAYRYMTPRMQQEFRSLSEERGLWAGAAVATHQDLSALFVLRAIERYLAEDGSFGFVMPLAVLSRQQFTGFRTGRYSLHQQPELTLAFERAWDLAAVKPTFFPVPPCVVLGRRGTDVTPLAAEVDVWSGRLSKSNVCWPAAAAHITRTGGSVHHVRGAAQGGSGSPYTTRFSQGATIVPRVLFVVEREPTGPLGAGAGRWPVRSRRTPNEKPPWKDVPTLRGNIERQFVKEMHLGETLLPYRTLEPLRAVIPWDGQRLLDSKDERLSSYPGLADWWTRAETIWNENRRNAKMSLRAQLDYRRKLSDQLPLPELRVVYTKSGMYLAAAIVKGDAIIDHKLYWGAATSLADARYLTAVLNSEAVTRRVRPLQARGEHNPRDYDKYVWQLPIPLYDGSDPHHRRLAQLAEHAETIAGAVKVPSGMRFETLRRKVREAVAASETGQEIERQVATLFSGG